jgi:hypothetical protein
MKRARPAIIDRRMVAVVSVAFAAGVFLVMWNREALRLEYGGVSVAWPILVSFGMVWFAGRRMGWRVAGGLVFGTVTALAAMYGGMSILPAASAVVLAGWIGMAAGFTALLSHLFARVISFPAAAVGYGIGLGIAASAQVRPTTAASDWLQVLVIGVTTMVLGCFGAQALRTILLATTPTPDALKTAEIMPRPAGAVTTPAKRAVRLRPPFARKRAGSFATEREGASR